MANEIELKLALAETGPDTLRHHPRLADLATTRRRLGNTYYDTPEGALAAAGMALRLRRIDGLTRQTLKTRGQGSGGLSQRGEWEWEVTGPGLDLDGLTGLPPVADLVPGVLERLTPRFTTDFLRETRLYHEGETRIELALDLGEIRAGERQVTIRELELELLDGEADRLLTLAESLAESVPLRPSDTSKAARGDALLGGGWTLPEGGTPSAWLHRATVALDALADTGDEAWRDAARHAFRQLAAMIAPAVGEGASWLADALAASRWLTPAFGRQALALARQLPDRVPLD